MKKISVVMMIRDEEKFLKQCLTSICNNLGDVELIVVDTGSRDSSIAIAKSFGAKIYEHPWQDDFSFHRNQSLSYASGNWCLVIDADEKLITSPDFNKNKLNKWLEMVQDKYNVVAIPIRDMQQGQTVMSCNSARLFKKGKVRYEHRIHNSPIFEGAAVLCDMLEIEHYGYDLSEEKMRLKFERTHSLLMKEMEDLDEEGNPCRVDTLFYLSQLLGHHGYTEESIKYGKWYISLKDKIPHEKFNRTIFFTIIKSLFEKNRMEEAYKLNIEALKENPYDPDLAYALSDWGAANNNLQVMADGARRFIRGYRELSEAPQKRGGQFYFSLRPDSLLLQTYRLAISSLNEGTNALNSIKPQLSNAPLDIIQELRTNLNGMGLSNLISDIEFKDETEKENNFKFDVFQVAI